MQVDLLVHSATQLVTCASTGGPKRGQALTDVGMVADGAVAVLDGEILDAGPSSDLCARYSAERTIDASGKVVSPGFVDAHTHVVYAGDRIDEFEMRIRGATYLQIMEAGGGIASTMRATREATVERLVAAARPRLDAMLSLGTTTIEAKTGYGLDAASEIRMLEAIATLDREHAVDLVPTFMGAHAVPPEFRNDSDGYVDLIIREMMPQAARWYCESHYHDRSAPLFCDVFCEPGAFDLDQTERVLRAGQAHDMALKLHADEFESIGGVGLAVGCGAVSVDHLDVTPPDEIERLAGADTVGVILPAVGLNLGSTRFAPARAMVDAGVALALATDLNPGSAPCLSMPLTMALACRYGGLLPAEALNAGTINAAYAVGLGERIGSIETGKQADLVVLDVPDYRHIVYWLGGNPVEWVVKRGQVIQADR